MSNYTQRTIYGTSIVFIFSLIAALFAYFFRLLLARNLSLAEFGLFYSLIAFTGFLTIFRDLGISQSVYYFIPRFISQDRPDKVKALLSKILKIEVITSFLILVILIFLSDFLVQHYFHAGNSKLIILFAIGFFFNSIELNFQTFFNAFQNQLLFSIHNLARNLVVFLLVLLAFVYFSGIYVPVIAYLITYALVLVIFSIIFFKKIFPEYFKVVSGSFSIKTLFLFGLPAVFSMFGFFLITYTDTLLLTYFRTMEEVGLYNAALPIISLMLFVPFSISAVILPLSSELWAKKKKASLRFAIENIIKYIFVFIIPVAGVLLLYPEITLNVLFGNKFIGASTALAILAAGAVFYGIAYINTTFLLGIVGPKINTVLSLSAAVLNLILNLVLIPKYGIIGAAIATSISYFVLFIASSIFLYSKIKIHVTYLKYFLVLVSGGVFMLLIHYLKEWINLPVIFEAILVISISGSLYGLLLFLFRIIKLKELKEIKAQILLKK